MTTDATARKASKVFWSQEEWSALAETLDHLRHDNPTLSKMAALGAAQAQVLAPGRSRKIVFWSTVAPKLDELLGLAKTNRLAKAVPPTEAPAKTAEQIRQEKLRAWVRTTAELFAPLFAEMLKQPPVAQELQKVLATLVTEPRPPVNTFAASFSAASEVSSTQTRRKVLVAGLLPAQANDVCSDLSALVEFRFWGSDESRHKLKTLARHCEVAVGVTNFLSHSADASLKALAPHYVRHTGGITRLKETLREVLLLPRASEAPRTLPH